MLGMSKGENKQWLTTDTYKPTNLQCGEQYNAPQRCLGSNFQSF
jgi:hypothetical protein